MSFTVGENVGAYRVVAQLGQGGMATVFKAYHPGLDRYVALKVMHAAFKQDETFIQRFNREARIVARLEHPNIVPVYDYSEHRGHTYLVMRFVEGETLKARLKRGPLQTDQIIQVASQVGAALGYAHKEGILHRDIKPSNVLVTGDPADPDALGDIYLTDFGLARIAEAGESTLSRDMMMGTPQYISPEQAKGTRDLDAGTDIYSMGVLLFEMVTGRVPFSADTPYSIIHDHIFTPLPLPTTINPDISKEVERVLLKALAKERADRYSDVDSFVTAFSKAHQLDEIVPADHIAAVPVQAPSAIAAAKPTPDPAPPTGDTPHAKAKPAKKRKRVWLFAAAGALALLCLCSLVLLGPVRENAQKNATATAQAAVPLPPPVKEPALAQEIAVAEEQLAQNPEDAVAHINLAWLYLQAEKVDAAEEHMHQAVELRPTEEWLYMDVGRYLIETGRPELAAEAYIIGLQVLPASEPLRIGLIELFWQEQLLEKHPAKAEMYARQLIEAAPEDPLFHLFLAQALVRNDKMDEGREELDSVLERHPDMAEAHFVNGIWFRKNHQFIQARREFRLALELAGDRDWLQRAIQRELNSLEGEE